MHHDLRSEFEVFLVEDVILTLGNLRGSLSWMGTSQSADPAIFRAGLDRLDRQIGLLEDRARALTRQMTAAATGDAVSVDLEVGPDPSSGSTADAGRGPAQVSSIAAAEARGDGFPEPVDPHAILQPPPDQEPEPVSPAFAGRAQRLSDDGDDLNIFGSDTDLLPDPSWSPSPVPFRSRRSGR